jgi:PAS domain S-box-containing protein
MPDIPTWPCAAPFLVPAAAVWAGAGAALLVLAGLILGLARRRRTRSAAGLGRLADLETHHGLFIEGVKEYAIIMLDPQGRVVTWNKGAERIKGYTAEEIIGRHFSCFYPAEDVAAGKPDRNLRQAEAEGSSQEEGWRLRKGGGRFYACALLTAVRDGSGRLAGFAKITKDISADREAQARIRQLTEDLERTVRAQRQELLESSAIIKGIIEYAPAAIALEDLQGRFLAVNLGLESLLGRPRSELLGRAHRDFLTGDLGGRFQERCDRVLGLRQSMEVEERLVHPDGTSHDYLSHLFPVVDEAGRCWGLGLIMTDLTERKRADRALLQSQKMESLGLLAAGIAHDFNNLLGAMQANLDLARLDLPAEAPEPEHHRVLETLVEQASYLVRQVSAYTGRAPYREEILALNQVVEEMIHLLRSSISRRAVIRYDPAPLLPPLRGDATQLRQLVMNLVINGSEALGEGDGTITLRTGVEQLSGHYIQSVYQDQDLPPGCYVSLEVADTGMGMDPELQKRIFDPFFTTKDTGRGLGLSAIQGIVKAHRGGIRVFSEPGRGTQIKVVLPAAEGAPGPVPELPEPAAGEFQGSGMVLVAEDEDRLRAAVVKLLNRLGFDTLQARDGLEALDLAQRHRDELRLILMDLTMPRMDGEEAYRELRQRGLGVPVILSSGYHEREALQRFRGQGLAGFLQKPYRYQALVRMVQAALVP